MQEFQMQGLIYLKGLKTFIEKFVKNKSDG